MTFEYIAGYFDGEGCLLFQIKKDYREEKFKGSQISGWYISPSWEVSSYDEIALQKIHSFLITNKIPARKFYVWPSKRRGHTKKACRLCVGTWDGVLEVIKKTSQFSIVKQEQFSLFIQLHSFLKTRDKNKRNKLIWTKRTFIDAMNIIDKINNLKSKKRGKYNASYFRSLWRDNV